MPPSFKMSPGFEIGAANLFAAAQKREKNLTLSLLSHGSNPCVATEAGKRVSTSHGLEGSGSYSLWQWQPTLEDLAPGWSEGAVTSLSAVPSGYSIPHSVTFQNERNSFCLGDRENKNFIPFRREKKKILFFPRNSCIDAFTLIPFCPIGTKVLHNDVF